MSNKIFVGGLDWNATERDLESTFGKVGEITEVKVITDRETGRSRGFGFVTFSDAQDAERAVEEFDGVELNGRSMRVNIAEDKKPRSNSGGGFRSGNRSNNRW